MSLVAALVLLAAASAPVVEPAIVTARLPALAPATRDEIVLIEGAALGVGQSLAEILQAVPDVQVQQPGGRPGRASLYLRGADPNFTVVMLDGVPLNNSGDSRGGAVDVSEISPLGLERVVVARGPLSGLYGSGALAGALDLVVPAGTQTPRGALLAGAGSRGASVAMGQWRGPVGQGLGGSLTATHDGDGRSTPGGRFDGRSLTGKLAPLDAGEDARLLFRLAETTALAFPDNSGGPRLAVLRDLDRRLGREALAAVRLRGLRRGDASLELQASALRRRDRLASGGVAPGPFDPLGAPAGASRTRFARDIVQVVGRFEPAAATQALVGLAFQRETGREAGVIELFGAPLPTSYRLRRDTLSAFAEAGLARGAWALDLAARLDRPQGLGAHVTGRASLRYAAPVTGLTFRASAGEGFKAPSFYALGNPFVGNPGLRPETSRSAELGLDWRLARGGRLSASVFSTRYANLIDFNPGPPPRLENLAAVTAKGAAAALDAELSPRLRAQLAATHVETRNARTGARLLNRPFWRASATLDWRPADRLQLRALLSHVGLRRDYSVPTGPTRLTAYEILALEAAWRPTPGFTLTAALDNALDDAHEDAAGFPSPGRRLRLIVRRDF